jgi:hypothetical protein
MRAIEARAVACGTAAFAALFIGLAAGCSARDREPLPDWTPPSIDAGTPQAPSEGGVAGQGDAVPNVIPSDHFGLRLPVLEYPARLRVVNTADRACSVKPAAGARQASLANEISCILDMNELDLAFQGLKFDVITPPGGCDYVIYRPYIYTSWKFGEGPKTVSYTVNADGTFTDEVNSENGKPSCEFDYSRLDPAFPNCCTGTYTLTIKSGTGGTTTTKVGLWGRTPISPGCFDGAAFLLENVKFDANGYPLDPIYFVDQLPRSIPIRHHDMLQYGRISVPLASFWQEGPNTRPEAAVKGLAPYGYDRSEYLVECVDAAEEVLARLHLHVREWNEKAELAKDGDPNTTGDEPYWGGPPHPIDDWLDWAALLARGIQYTRVVRQTK